MPVSAGPFDLDQVSKGASPYYHDKVGSVFFSRVYKHSRNMSKVIPKKLLRF